MKDTSQETQRGFTGIWLPASLYLRKDLPWAAKILWCEIVALHHSEHGCIASNSHFARHLSVSDTYASKLITLLKKKGLLKSGGFDGRRRLLIPLYDTASLEQINKPALNKSARLTRRKVQGKYNINENIKSGTRAEMKSVREIYSEKGIPYDIPLKFRSEKNPP